MKNCALILLFLLSTSPGFADTPAGFEFDGVDDTASAGAGMVSTFTDDYSIAGTVTILDDTLSISGQTIFSQPHDGTTTGGIKGIYRNSAAQPELFEVELTIYFAGSGYATIVFNTPAPVLIPFDFVVTVRHWSNPVRVVAKIYIDTIMQKKVIITGAEAGTQPTQEFWIGTDADIDKYATMLLCRMSVWSNDLMQAEVTYISANKVLDTDPDLVSAWESMPGHFAPIVWYDVAGMNDLSMSEFLWKHDCEEL